MNQKEFDKWVEDYLATFPQAATWLSKSPDPPRTLERWFIALKKIPLICAATVTDQMANGELDMVEAYEREKTALIVRRYAWAIENRKATAKETDEHRVEAEKHRDDPEYFPAGAMFIKSKELWAEANERFDKPFQRNKFVRDGLNAEYEKLTGKKGDL
jgi:hypothetical protein